MIAECTQKVFRFHPLRQREIWAQFDGGAITSDGGGLLLRDVEKRTGVIRQFAACFTDHRDPERIDHTVWELVAQRVYGLALGYEDLNDHDELRKDPLLAVLVEKSDPVKEALAGKSTLNRLELTGATVSEEERYKKIVLDHAAVDRLLVEVFLQAHAGRPKEIILDLDATDDPLHGNQEGRFFHGYHGTEGVGLAGQWVSLRHAVPTSPCKAVRRAAKMLKKNSPPEQPTHLCRIGQGMRQNTPKNTKNIV